MAMVDVARAFAGPVSVSEGSALTAQSLGEGEGDVRLDVHDASRLEWSVGVPLPQGEPLSYLIEVEMEIPANAFAVHSPWNQLQSFTRLDGAELRTLEGDVVTIDALRRGALGLAHKMAKASDGFARHCLLAASLFTRIPKEDLEGTLLVWIDGAVAMAEEARAKLVIPRDADPQDLARERRLVDEFVSVRLLEMLAGAERGLSVLRGSRAPHACELAPIIAAAESRIGDALEGETARRVERGYVSPDHEHPELLDRYLERASRLKKHFQEVLFLEPETFKVAERLHHWVAAFGALVASTWAFAWQLALTKRAGSPSTLSSGIIMLAVVASVIYATKDRLKEVGREWLHGNVHRFYAQRVARYRAPARRLPKRDVVVTARESFDQRTLRLPDPLNPESGATVPATRIRYVHRAKAHPVAALSSSGIRRIKHVFRYDLSPLFARLDDAVKKVPVLDRERRRMCLTEAPRCYRFPVRVSVTYAGHRQTEEATVVLRKGGLDRLERRVPGDEDGLG
jgi:hypothetical protein